MRFLRRCISFAAQCRTYAALPPFSFPIRCSSQQALIDSALCALLDSASDLIALPSVSPAGILRNQALRSCAAEQCIRRCPSSVGEREFPEGSALQEEFTPTSLFYLPLTVFLLTLARCTASLVLRIVPAMRQKMVLNVWETPRIENHGSM